MWFGKSTEGLVGGRVGAWVVVGAAVTAAGLAIAATAPAWGGDGPGGSRASETLGGVLVLVGWVVLAWATHRLGRAG